MNVLALSDSATEVVWVAVIISQVWCAALLTTSRRPGPWIMIAIISIVVWTVVGIAALVWG